MYIQKNLTTSSVPVPGLSYELTPVLEQKYHIHGAFSKLVFDEHGQLINIVEDTEKRAAWQAGQDAIAPARNRAEVRRQRGVYLRAFDIYKSNVAYGIEAETPEQHNAVCDWYKSLLDITDEVTAKEIPVMPKPPDCIQRYLTEKEDEVFV